MSLVVSQYAYQAGINISEHLTDLVVREVDPYISCQPPDVSTFLSQVSDRDFNTNILKTTSLPRLVASVKRTVHT